MNWILEEMRNEGASSKATQVDTEELMTNLAITQSLI